MRCVALLVALAVAAAVGPAAARPPLQQTSCKDYSAGTDCEAHDCTTCQMDLGITKISFCVEPETAETLPKGKLRFLKHRRPAGLPSPVALLFTHTRLSPLPPEMFTCGVEPPTPPTLAVGSDECSDLDKGGCEGEGACAWCVSAAVPSACYTVEQAKRLPAAVFACEMPDAAAAEA